MIRFARCTILVLLAGYLIFNKPFALLGVMPFYAGEVALLILLVTSLIHFRTFWIEPLKNFWMPRLTLAFLIYGSIRVLVDIAGHYPDSMDAARDGVCVGYALFALLAPPLVLKRTGYFESLLIGMSFLALNWVFLNQFISVTTELPRVLTNNNKPDMLSLSALVAAWVFGWAAYDGHKSIQFLQNLPSRLGGFDPSSHTASSESWKQAPHVKLMVSAHRKMTVLNAMLSIFAFILVFRMRTRAAWLAAAVLIAFLIALNIRRLLNRYAFTIAAVAAALIWFIGVPWFEHSQTPLAEKVRATFGAQPYELIGGDAQNVSRNTEWRRIFWKRCIEQTVARAPWFGLGFGVNLTDLMVQTPDWWRYIDSQKLIPPNRNPHNAAVTILSRSGFVGLALWAALMIGTAIMGFRSCLAPPPAPPSLVGKGVGGLGLSGKGAGVSSLIFGVWLIYVSYALVGDVIENPFGGIWFWVLTGAIGALEVARASVPARPSESPDSQSGELWRAQRPAPL